MLHYTIVVLYINLSIVMFISSKIAGESKLMDTVFFQVDININILEIKNPYNNLSANILGKYKEDILG